MSLKCEDIKKGKNKTWGKANLSRLGAYGVGTSAPAILSTGASR